MRGVVAGSSVIVTADLSKRKKRVLINPPGSQIGAQNTILWGRAKQYYVADFPGPLSIKSVVQGAAIWETEEAERLVDTGSYLVLNAGRQYSITIDSRDMVETFCLFFRPGFAEDVLRVESGEHGALLDEPLDLSNGKPSTEFFETLHAHDRVVSPLLREMHARVRAKCPNDAWLEDRFFEVAKALRKIQRRTQRQLRGIPAKKVSTRTELYRRLLRGKDYMDSFFSGEVQLRNAAGAACLSPYHFHRLFHEVFHETPNQYLQRKRLAQARELLKSSDRGVTEISLDVGFESSTSFSALFRRSFGCSPREYRATLRKK
jgi:AraC family transcriptional regulator